jgi:hypothetical protein
MGVIGKNSYKKGTDHGCKNENSISSIEKSIREKSGISKIC